MLTTVLLIIGILLVVYSISTIKKDLLKDKSIVEDLSLVESKIKDYYDLTEETILDFDKLIDGKLDIINKERNDFKEKDIDYLRASNYSNVGEQTDKGIDDTLDSKLDHIPNIKPEIINSMHKKIFDLNDLGLTKIEIAKTLNKGVREIDIVLNIYGNKDIKKT